MLKHLGCISLLFCTGTFAANDSVRLSGSQRRIVVTPGVDAIVPQLVDGAGWKTSFFVTNLDSKPINFAVLFSDDRGELLRLPVAGIGSVAVVYGTLQVNASATFETEGNASALAQGYAVVVTLDRPASDASAQATFDRIAGMAVFRQRVANRPDFEAVVPFSPLTETQMVVPFDNRNGLSTGLAIVNPDFDNAAAVEVTLRADSGTILAQQTVQLPASAKLTFSVPDRFPESRGQSGRINLRTSATFLSALGLRFNPSGAFTSFHSLSIDAAIAPPPAPAPSAGTLSGVAQTCSAIMNAQIYGDDGTFLGRINTNAFQSDSIANQFGRYGSPFSTTSIFNSVGTYGSTVSALSPFNPVASRPPILFLGLQAVAYLTANAAKVPRIDPTFAIACVGRTR